MGGTNEITVAGLRIHRNNGEVHIHNDEKGKKFSLNERSFSTEIKNAMGELKKNETVCVIKGTGSDLCIGKSGQSYFMALAGNATVSEINDLTSGI